MKLCNLLTIKDFIKVLWETHSIHKMINVMYYDPDTIIIKKDVFDIIKTRGNLLYHIEENINSVWGIGKNYDIDQIGNEDIVVDLGSCIGAFTLPAATRAKKVYAIEPLFARELTENIKLNGLANIEVIEVGIGDKDCRQTLTFGHRSKEVSIVTFAELRQKIGHIDYIKIDIEGWEWGIDLRDLSGIKRIAFEPHIRLKYRKRDEQTLQEWIKWLESNGYEYTLDWLRGYPISSFSRCGVLHAATKLIKAI